MHEIILPTFGLYAHTALMIYIIIGLAIFSVLLTRRLAIALGQTQSLIELAMSAFLKMVDENMGHKGKKILSVCHDHRGLHIRVERHWTHTGVFAADGQPQCHRRTRHCSVLRNPYNRLQGARRKIYQALHRTYLVDGPLLLPLEIIGHLARPLSLSLRLFGNMMGHELIVVVLLHAHALRLSASCPYQRRWAWSLSSCKRSSSRSLPCCTSPARSKRLTDNRRGEKG